MIDYSDRALDLIDELRAHFVRKGWLEPLQSLRTALIEAEARIGRDPSKGLPAPRPYPELAADGERWIHVRRYWIAYTTTDPPIIIGVFYDTADIPGRVKRTL